MKKVSATQIKTYRECRQQYFDTYIKKVPRVKNTAALLGTGLHKAIELYYTRGEPPIPTFSRYIRKVTNDWQDAGEAVEYYYSQAEIMEVGLEILRGFNFSELRCKFSEFSFNLPFYDIANINGIIDMVTTDEGLIDFKSAKRPPKLESLQKDPQFLIYPWAYFQLFGKWPKYIAWYHLRTHEKFEFQFDWNNFDHIVVSTVREMVADDFSDLTGESCSKCSMWCYRYRNRQ